YSCSCPPGITGDDCEIDIDECAGQPCQNGSTCFDLVNDYFCQCMDGYSDKNCSTDDDECAYGACINGSTCVDLVFDYECLCPDGYIGKNCHIDLNECEPASLPADNPFFADIAGSHCQNGASCNDLVNEYSCNCLPGFFGKDCEIDINECATETQVGAATPPTSGATADHIQVLSQRTHIPGCVDAITFTLGAPPTNGGQGWEVRAYSFVELQPAVLSDLGLLIAAQPLPQVSSAIGVEQTVQVEPCMPVPAFAHIGITSTEGALRSGIDDDAEGAGYWGLPNQPSAEPFDFTDPTNPANPLPQLFMRNSGDPGFSVSISHDVPCQNGSTCNDLVNSYSCTCPPGFSDYNCTTNIDECVVNHNGTAACESGDGAPGTAIWSSCCLEDQEDTVVAERVGCDDGICEAAVCDIDPSCCGDLGGHWNTDCVNLAVTHCGALCIAAPVCGDGVCNGSEDCDTCSEDCLSTHCRNGATCHDGDFDYTCTCAPGFVNGDLEEQKDCEVDQNNCQPEPCENGGTCVDRVDAWACICPVGYGGNKCQNDLNDCAPNPCENGGVCFDALNDYTCLCEDGFSGKDCENNDDDCDPDPCLNGSVCSDLVDDYFCACPGGFVG
ncbi:MAG: hypothetical protein QF464_13505, partial [Myxococcota bacterium]|nr:hypothetical protein [Myxococcota bacterium]